MRRSGDNLGTTYTVKTTTGHLHSEQARGVVKSASDFPAVSRFNSARATVSGLLFVLRWVNGVVSRAFNWDLRSVDFGSSLRESWPNLIWLIRWLVLVSTDIIGLWYVNSLDSTLFLRKPGNVNLNFFNLSPGTSLLVRVIMHKWVRGRLNSMPRHGMG